MESSTPRKRLWEACDVTKGEEWGVGGGAPPRTVTEESGSGLQQAALSSAIGVGCV